MINTKYCVYNFFTLGPSDAYGQQTISQQPTGQIKAAIFTRSQSAQDNILYQDAQYLALTHDTKVDDTYIIEYGQERLKVLYVAETAQNRPRQIFLSRMG